MLIQIDRLTVAPGERNLIQNASWRLNFRQRVAVVGRNGTGKTSLLRCLVGEMLPLSGEIKSKPGLKIGYLPQTAVSGSESTLWKEVQTALTDLQELKAKLSAAEHEMQTGDPDSIAKYSHLLEQWQSIGGYTEEEQIGRVLHGLGFSPEDWHKPCCQFSGGWQMRIALAKILLSKPDVAILDEPTNHLDLHARVWLANHLSASTYSLIVVSHDRYFLNKIASHTLEIRDQKLHQYTGNINHFLKERELRIRQAHAHFDKVNQKREHLQSFIDRFGAKATKAKQAQSRQKQLDGMEQVNRPGTDDKSIKIRFSEGPPSAAIPIRLKACSIGWDTSLLNNVSFEFQRGMRLALIGANGTGKSTLLKTLIGDLPCLDGRVHYGDRLMPGIFHQDLAQELPAEASPLEYLQNCGLTQNSEEIRTVLGSLGLNGASHTRSIQQLSGGEKARVALSQLVCEQSNMLFLDEPTNHLDIETADALADALKSYSGAICFISHDRSLVEEIATHIGRIEGDQLFVEAGVEPQWLVPHPYQPSINLENNAQGVGKSQYLENKARSKRRRKLTKELNKIEGEINKAESDLDMLDSKLNEAGDDYQLIQGLAKERSVLECFLEDRMVKWESVSTDIEDIDTDK